MFALSSLVVLQGPFSGSPGIRGATVTKPAARESACGGAPATRPRTEGRSARRPQTARTRKSATAPKDRAAVSDKNTGPYDVGSCPIEGQAEGASLLVYIHFSMCT